MDASGLKDIPHHYRLGAFVLALPLVLTGCSTEPGTAATPPSRDTAPSSSSFDDSSSAEVATGEASATFQIAGSTFEFSPTLCIVGEEDIVAQGAGTNIQTGEIAFLDADFTTYEGSYVGGADIELGTDQPFTSPDDYYRLDPLVNDEGFDLSVTGASFTVEGTFYGQGAAQLPNGDAAQGTLQVSCEGTTRYRAAARNGVQRALTGGQP